MELQEIKIPHIKVEKLIDDKWVDTGTVRIISSIMSSGRYPIKFDITQPGENTDFIVNREDILKVMEEENQNFNNLRQLFLIVDDAYEGQTKPEAKTDAYNRMTFSGPIEIKYKVVDKSSIKPYSYFSGYTQWRKDKIQFQSNFLEYYNYFETSDISLELMEKDRIYLPEEEVDIKVNIKNTSKNIINKSFYTGVDLGYINDDNKENIISQKPYSYLEEIEKNSSHILNDINPGETYTFNSKIKLPKEFEKSNMDKDGNLIITPFITGVIARKNKTGKFDWFIMPREREHNEPIKISTEKINLKFDSNGGKFDNGKSIKDLIIYIKNKTISEKDIDTPSKDGYDFVGWYTDEALINEYDFDNLVNKDFTLYAKWKVKETPVKPVERLSDTVVLASGYKYTDVLTATVLANEKHAPILLSEVDTLTDDTMTELKRINPTEIIISGGENSVSKKVENLLKSEISDISITRISGRDRYETAKNIGVKVREISPNKTEAMLVDGTNFPDVITMSTIASEKRAPILLTEPNILNETTKNTLTEFNIKDIIIGGGFDSVSENIEKNLKTNIGTIRYGGSDRYETASIVGNEYVNLTGKSGNLIIVDGTNFPDGITTSSLANKFEAPILLTAPNNLPQSTKDNIANYKATNTIIAGGEESVSENIFKKVNGSERISGKDRYETAVKISQKYLEDK